MQADPDLQKYAKGRQDDRKKNADNVHRSS